MGLIKWYLCNFTDLRSYVSMQLQNDEFVSLEPSNLNNKVTSIFNDFFKDSIWPNGSKKSAIKSCIKEYARTQKANEIALLIDIIKRGHFSGTDSEYKNYKYLSKEEVDFTVSKWTEIMSILERNGIHYIDDDSENNTITNDINFISKNNKIDSSKIKKVINEYSKLCAEFYLEKINKKYNLDKELILNGANYSRAAKKAMEFLSEGVLDFKKQQELKNFKNKTLIEICINKNNYTNDEKTTFEEFGNLLINQKFIDKINAIYKIKTECPKAVRKFHQIDLKFIDLVKTESKAANLNKVETYLNQRAQEKALMDENGVGPLPCL